MGDERKEWERQLTEDIAGVLVLEPEHVTVANCIPGPSVLAESVHGAPSGYGGKTTVVVTVHITCSVQKKNEKRSASTEEDDDKLQHREGPAHLLAHVMLAHLENKEGPFYKGDVTRGVLDGYKVEAHTA